MPLRYTLKPSLTCIIPVSLVSWFAQSKCYTQFKEHEPAVQRVFGDWFLLCGSQPMQTGISFTNSLRVIVSHRAFGVKTKHKTLNITNINSSNNQQPQ